MFGGMAAHSAIALGLAGLVTDGSVRDVREIRRLGFGLWAGGVSPLGARKDVPGDLNVPVVCGGVLVRPGDLVIADDDGVAVVPAERAAEVLELALARERKEAALAELLDSGRSTLDALGFRDRVDELLART
jgi:4-hydroxy-4-methyl-2-oxoglutarate aldolase